MLMQVETASLPKGQRGWPWQADPYRLWSVLEMLTPWAQYFGELLSCILDCEHTLSERDPAAKIESTYQYYIRHILNTAHRRCKELGLDSGGQIDRLLGVLDPSLQEQVMNFPIPTAGDMRVKLRTLRESLDRELKSRLFLFVPAAKAETYDQVELFGPEVHTKFSKASADIREAGTCLALGRATAAVFHLMCVLEVGLDSLSSALSVPYSQKNWEQILRDIETAISTIAFRQDREFYSRAALEFKFFRDAWRNHTMHGRGKYGDVQAEEIFDHVKAFMVHLATRLQERP